MRVIPAVWAISGVGNMKENQEVSIMSDLVPQTIITAARLANDGKVRTGLAKSVPGKESLGVRIAESWELQALNVLAGLAEARQKQEFEPDQPATQRLMRTAQAQFAEMQRKAATKGHDVYDLAARAIGAMLNDPGVLQESARGIERKTDYFKLNQDEIRHCTVDLTVGENLKAFFEQTLAMPARTSGAAVEVTPVRGK